MNALLLCCLVLGAPTAYGDYPVLSEIRQPNQRLTCDNQRWAEELQDSTKWNEGTNRWNGGQGTSAVSFDKALKNQLTKIADFFIELSPEPGRDAAVLCTIWMVGAEADIEAFWVTKADTEEIESFAIGDADGNKQQVRFGIRAAKGNPGLYARVEVYGKVRDLKRLWATCGAGKHGEECEGLKLWVRNREDTE